MLYPVRMKKADIIVSAERKEDVIRELKEKGIIQLVKVKQEVAEEGKTSWVRLKACELLSRTERILEAFKVIETKKGLLSQAITVIKSEKIRKKRVKDLPATELFKQVEQKLAKLEKIFEITKRLDELKDKKSRFLDIKYPIDLLKQVETSPKELHEYKFVFVVAGKIPTKEIEKVRKNLEEITKSYFVYSKEIKKGQSFVVLMTLKKYEQEIERILNASDFEVLQIEASIQTMDLNKASRYVESNLNSIEQEAQKLTQQVKLIFDKEKQNLLALRELLLIEKKLDEANLFFGKTYKTYLLSGWVQTDKVDELETSVKRASDNHYTLTTREPEKDEKPPTILANKGPAKGLEVITQTYGLPSYNELDPSNLITLTFPLLFGFMFGDVGHGIVLALIGYLLGYRLKFGATAKKLGQTLLLCGIVATFVGFLYGSVFGLTHEHFSFMFKPLWLDPLTGGGKNIMILIKVAIYLALAVLTLGCCFNTINKARRKSILHAIFDPWGVLGLCVLWGGASLFFAHGVEAINLTITGLTGNFEVLFSILPGLALIVIPLGLLIIGQLFITKESFALSFYTAFEVLQKFLVNTISYIRVVIIGVVHAALLLMVIKVMEMFSSTFVGILGSILVVGVFIIGNLIVFGMEAMIAFVQTLRLHYYELFSKFFEAKGKRFDAFKVSRNYTTRGGVKSE